MFIEDSILVNIRFSEVDSLGIVWHGNYLKFFEDGRESLGRKYGMGYAEYQKHLLIMPIVKTNLSFKAPLRIGHTALVQTRFLKNRAAKVIHQYKVFNQTTGMLAAVGSTTQVFVNPNMELQLFTPQVFEDWKEALAWTTE